MSLTTFLLNGIKNKSILILKKEHCDTFILLKHFVYFYFIENFWLLSCVQTSAGMQHVRKAGRILEQLRNPSWRFAPPLRHRHMLAHRLDPVAHLLHELVLMLLRQIELILLCSLPQRILQQGLLEAHRRRELSQLLKKRFVFLQGLDTERRGLLFSILDYTCFFVLNGGCAGCTLNRNI